MYNRYSHVSFIANDERAGEFMLSNADAFTVNIDPCSPVLVELGVKYHVFNNPAHYSCLKEIRQVAYPATRFYIYERLP